MSLLYISILWVCACVDSVESLVTVSAQVGSTVILPCNLTEEFKQSSVIRWKINNDFVFERNSDGPYSSSGYKGRVDVPVDELRKGNCSLELKNVRFTDDQTFITEYVDTNTKEVKEINRVYLSVYALQISAPVGSTVVLPCDWSHLSIKTPDVKWFIDSETVFERKGKEINQSERYEGRVDVPEDELLKGNCSLVMKNIRFSDKRIYSSSMIKDIQESVLVQKVKLSVVGGSRNETHSSSEDSDSHQTGGTENIWIILMIIMFVCSISVLIIIICMCVFCSRVEGKLSSSLSSCCSHDTSSTEQDEKIHHDSSLYDRKFTGSVKINKASDLDCVTYVTFTSQPQRH